jgi:hypothetical protein
MLRKAATGQEATFGRRDARTFRRRRHPLNSHSIGDDELPDVGTSLATPLGDPRTDSTGKRKETITAHRNIVAAAADYGCRSYRELELEPA